MLDKVSYRDVSYNGIRQLLWPTEDTGAFGMADGPLNDWRLDSEKFLSFTPHKGTVVQAGGCCGMYPLLYSKEFEHVVTYEPDDLNYFCLVENCKTAINIAHFHGAVGDSHYSLMLRSGPSNNVGMHRVENGTMGNVYQYRIDDLQLTECDLIHLDVEGYESHALRGALETIKQFKPVIILERAIGKEVIEPLGYKEAFVGRMDTVFIPTL